eukprot:4425268-Pyramimonas_sp.AAC.1
MPLAEVYAPMSRHHLRVTSPKLLMPRIAQGLGTLPGYFFVPALLGWVFVLNKGLWSPPSSRLPP